MCSPQISGRNTLTFEPVNQISDISSLSSQDEARRVLQDMFKDKPDTLAFYDVDGGGKGGGKGGKGRRGGGGGDDAGSGGFDWRENIRGWLSGLGKNTSGVFKAIGAALLFGFMIGAGAF